MFALWTNKPTFQSNGTASIAPPQKVKERFSSELIQKSLHTLRIRHIASTIYLTLKQHPQIQC